MTLQYIVTCKECGKTEDLRLYQPMAPLTIEMREKQLCFNCLYWNWTLKSGLNANEYVIGGSVYHIEKLCVIKRIPVQASVRKIILDTQDKKVYNAVNMALRYNIPPNHRCKFPTIYKFITTEEYKRFRQYGGGVCQSKGCFDRYNCLWYDAEIIEPNGPWNELPRNYKPDMEGCLSFINKNAQI